MLEFVEDWMKLIVRKSKDRRGRDFVFCTDIRPLSGKYLTKARQMVKDIIENNEISYEVI